MLRTGLKFAANGDAAASLLADIFNENRHRPRAVVDIEKQRAVEAPKTEAPTPDLSQLDDIRGALAGQYDAPIRLDPVQAPEPAMKVEAALLAAAQEELAAAQEALAAAPKPDDLVVPSAVMRGQERLKTADEETVLRAAALIAARRMEAIGPSPPPPKPPTPKPVNPENTVPEDKPGEKPLDSKSRQKWQLATMAFSKAWGGRAKKEEQRLQAKPLDELVQEKPIKTAAHKPLAEDSKKGQTKTSKSRQARVQEAARLGLGSHASGAHKGQHNSQVSKQADQAVRSDHAKPKAAIVLSGHSLQQWKDAKEVYGTLPFHTDTVVHGASKDEKRQLLKEKSRQRKAQEKQNSSQSKPSSLNPTPEPGSV